MNASGGEQPWILAIDTGTSEIVVAAGTLEGAAVDVLREPAGFRHGELILPLIERLIAGTGLRRERLSGIVVGTGPGAFTGLRVGLATAKTMAHALGIPIVGVSTATALIRAADDGRGTAPPDTTTVLLMPAGPRDRTIVRRGEAPRLLADPAELDTVASGALVAVDLVGRAPDDAVERGEEAQGRFGATLVELGAARLRAGDFDEAAQLVPEYVTLPRGISVTTGAIEWSHDPR